MMMTGEGETKRKGVFGSGREREGEATSSGLMVKKLSVRGTGPSLYPLNSQPPVPLSGTGYTTLMVERTLSWWRNQ